MLLWINGAHGVGKTQVAFELRSRCSAVWVSDPEHLGFALRRMLPDGRTRDFRELHVWRTGVRAMLEDALNAWRGTIVVPQTLTDPDLLAEIVLPLRAAGHDVRHVALVASTQELRRRLRLRGETSRGFAAGHLDHAVAALEDPRFAEHVATDGRSIGDVAEDVARRAGLTLAPDAAGTLRRCARRMVVQLRHVRHG